MKKIIILLLFTVCSKILIFSQSTLLEFIVEKDDNPQVFYKGKGCTPDVGVLVFYTTIPDLQFSMPDNPGRLKSVSAFDSVNNCYALCIQPTGTTIGSITQYSLAITANGYKPMPAFTVSEVLASQTQYFRINSKIDLDKMAMQEEIIQLRKELANIKKGSQEYAESSAKINTLVTTAQQAAQSESQFDDSKNSLTITGRVSDGKEALIGTSIMVKGTTIGAVADIDGNFSMKVPANSVLVFNYIGYERLEVPIKGRTKIEVNMKEKAFYGFNWKHVSAGLLLNSKLRGETSIGYQSGFQVGWMAFRYSYKYISLNIAPLYEYRIFSIKANEYNPFDETFSFGYIQIPLNISLPIYRLGIPHTRNLSLGAYVGPYVNFKLYGNEIPVNDGKWNVKNATAGINFKARVSYKRATAGICYSIGLTDEFTEVYTSKTLSGNYLYLNTSYNF